MFTVPNKYRERNHSLLKSEDSDGNNGFFVMSYNGYEVRCQASDGGGWEHVSVTINSPRCPGWDIMCFVKDTFWSKDDCVVQFHPPEMLYANDHEYCLHLWRPIGKKIELPPSIFVGLQHRVTA
jgi:hypothetical protein